MITKNDGYIGRVVDAIKERGWLEDTLILVEADHGGTPPDAEGHGTHGGDSDGEKWVSFFAAGGGAQHAELQDMMVRDTAPAILHALGLEIPETWNSRVPGGLFPDIPENLPRPEGIDFTVQEPDAKPETGAFERQLSGLDPVLRLSFESFDDLPEGTERTGKLYLVQGVRGRGMRFDDGGLSVPCPLGSGSFSLSAWVRLNALGDPMPIAAVYDPAEPASKFSVMANARNRLSLTVKTLEAEKEKYMELGFQVCAAGTWIFTVLTFDAETGTTGISLNFGPQARQTLPGRKLLEDRAAPRLFLGIDDRSAKDCRLPGTLDDVCVYRKALSDAEIAALKAYYLEDPSV